MAQGPAQGVNLVLVGHFLAFGQFERFENFFHVIQSFPEAFDHLADFLNGLLHIGG